METMPSPFSARTPSSTGFSRVKRCRPRQVQKGQSRSVARPAGRGGSRAVGPARLALVGFCRDGCFWGFFFREGRGRFQMAGGRAISGDRTGLQVVTGLKRLRTQSPTCPSRHVTWRPGHYKPRGQSRGGAHPKPAIASAVPSANSLGRDRVQYVTRKARLSLKNEIKSDGSPPMSEGLRKGPHHPPSEKQNTG